MNENLLPTFQRLFEVVHELRVKCPWDKKQTKESLRYLTIEETYELSDAILENDWEELKVEVGDLLLHILFYARLGEEQGAFTTTEMIQSLTDKLIRRHPHIYGDVNAHSAEEVITNWEKIKLREKKEAGQRKSVLSGVPKGLPSLIKAMRIQEKVKSVGFDWENPGDVWEKVKEEMGELQVEIEKEKAGNGSSELVQAEFGDLLFALVNYARHLNVNPEDALEKTNRKFQARFDYLEERVWESGKDLKSMSLEEMDLLWDEAKAYES